MMQYAEDLGTAQALWDHMPLGVLVLDDAGVIRMVNQRALDMTGWVSFDEVVGRSVLDFVVADDVGFVIAGLDRSDDFTGLVLGPFQIRYVTRDGDERWSESWAYEALSGFGFVGHVVTLAAESGADHLAAATRCIAAGRPLDVTLTIAAASLGAYPVLAASSILLVDDHRLADTIGEWPLDLPPCEGISYTPWDRCAADGTAIDLPVEQLPDVWRHEAQRHGFAAVWVRAIEADRRRAVLVMWRGSDVAASPNQLRSISDAIGVAHLACTRHDHQALLARAAHTDELTGVGNRAKLNALMSAETSGAGVLYIDLDDFKSVNDDHGHHVGDVVLSEVAARVEHVLDDQAELFRIGGDEFVAIVTATSDQFALPEVTALAAGVIDVLNEPFLIDDQRLVVSASVGVAANPGAERLHTLLRRADRHLLAAKRQGKSRWRARPATATTP